MNRRTLFQTLFGGIVASKVPVKVEPQLSLCKDAFEIVGAGLPATWNPIITPAMRDSIIANAKTMTWTVPTDRALVPWRFISHEVAEARAASALARARAEYAWIHRDKRKV